MGTNEGCFTAEQFFVWHSFSPVFPIVSPPQIWDRLEGEKYIFLILLIPCLVLFEFVDELVS